MLIVTKKLIEELKAKDEFAFEQVYYEYVNLVYYICYSITKDKNASEDLTQDTFLKLLTSLDNYTETGKLKQYIMMIARNLAKNYVTRVANKKPIYSDEEIYSVKEDSNNRLLINDITNYLNETQSEIIILKIVHKLKFREIAEYLSIHINKVTAEYYTALKILRREMI